MFIRGPLPVAVEVVRVTRACATVCASELEDEGISAMGFARGLISSR